MLLSCIAYHHQMQYLYLSRYFILLKTSSPCTFTHKCKQKMQLTISQLQTVEHHHKLAVNDPVPSAYNCYVLNTIYYRIKQSKARFSLLGFTMTPSFLIFSAAHSPRYSGRTLAIIPLSLYRCRIWTGSLSGSSSLSSLSERDNQQ